MEPATTAALISGGVKLLGGLFGKKKKATLVDLRRQAENAGFNPLTALQATGGNGYTPGTQGPVLSTREVLADGVGDLAETWFNRDQIRRDEQVERLKLETMGAELDNIKARTKALNMSGPFGASIPTYEASNIAPAKPPALEAGPRTATDPRDTDSGDYRNPRVADAELTETADGEIMAEISGVGNQVRHWNFDARMQAAERQWGKKAASEILRRYEADPSKDLDKVLDEYAETQNAPLAPRSWMKKTFLDWLN